ncbi:hypothetical protein ENSA5_69580 [Enhygromyxa salina]|uniref:ATP-dependent helicase HepA n=1 Tax=Enhygromyxa salina TaxID=215803 RepID=A0A2S9XAN7_9BACT|nr:DEAD/DEAH box helicase [Enhygromyxa salina]PRP89922.1 hypothetical protein ENSA5_69580 [Enhygromyxa salina]
MTPRDRPPPEQLTVARVRGLLTWLSHRGRLPDEALARVPELVLGAQILVREWASDQWLEFPDGEGMWRRVDARCGCKTHDQHGFCEHRAAVVVFELWRRPDGRDLFERPCWQLELGYLLRDHPNEGLEPSGAPPPSPRSDRACRLLIHVFPTGGYERGFDFDVRLVRANKRGDGWLKPIRCPSAVDKLLAKAKPSDELLRVHDLVAQLAELRKLDTYSRQAPRLRARIAHELLGALEQAGDELELRWEQLPITASTLAWRPTLRVSAGAPGKLEARWSEGVLDHWRLEPSIVLTASGVLRPLAEDVPVHLLDRIGAAAVVLDVEDFDELARTILAHAPVPIEIPAPVEVGASAVARRVARLYLEERGEVLRATAKLAYELSDGRCVEFGVEDRAGLSFGDDLTLVRDATWERARRAEFEARVGREASVELLAEGAWTFLAEGLAALRERGWEVFGEASLTRNRVLTEPLRPRMKLGPSTDWFELEVDFEAEGPDGHALPAPQVIDSWLAGQRFVRLPDERIAALPSRWLDRHGRALAELVELGSDSDHGLGAHALPLADELLSLGELVGDDPEQVERAAHWRGRARALGAFEGVAEREPPPGLQAELRGYQRRGYAWLCFLRDHGLGGCLADDMGLGKTLQALALLLDTHGKDAGAKDPGPPSLIVCPTSVLHVWREQAERFVPSLRIHLHHGPRRGTPPAEVDVIATSYALLRQDAELWAGRRFRHLILDEAQALKNPDSQVARVARSLAVAHPVALTGTPLENNVLELWSLFELLMPGFFGSRRRFRRRWVDPIHKHEDAAALARLRRRVRPFLLRRLKSEVATELPPKQTQILRCRLGKEQRQLYERVRQTYRSSVFGAVDQRGVGGAALHILEALTRLRQACCHPALLPFPEAREVGGRVAKLELLRLLLDQAIADRHRSLVFSQWPSFLDRVADTLSAAGIAHLRLDGRTRDRSAVLERWSDPAGPPVFLISTKAGGLGLDLTEADHVFHLDPWWNPAAEDQATDRAHRIGQSRPVMVYKLVAADTVEDKILELQARKRRLFRATVDTDRLEVDALDRADLEAVFADPGASAQLDSDDGDELDELEWAAQAAPEPWVAEDATANPRALAEFVALPSKPAPAPGSGLADERESATEAAEVIELFPGRPER